MKDFINYNINSVMKKLRNDMTSYLKILPFLIFLGCSDDNNVESKIIEESANGKVIFIKVMTWGLTGDNKIIYISQNNDIKDTLDDLKYNVDYFFYKFNNDTLNTYSLSKNKSKVSSLKQIEHVEHVLSNESMMELTQTYKAKGLKQITWADEKLKKVGN